MVDEPIRQPFRKSDEISVKELNKLLVGEFGVGETERHFDQNRSHVPVLEATKTSDDSGRLMHAAGAHEHDRMSSAVEGDLESLFDELLGDGLPRRVGLPLFCTQVNQLNVVLVAKRHDGFEGRFRGQLDKCAQLETLQKFKIVWIDLLCSIHVRFHLRKHLGRRENRLLIRIVVVVAVVDVVGIIVDCYIVVDIHMADAVGGARRV